LIWIIQHVLDLGDIAARNIFLVIDFRSCPLGEPRKEDILRTPDEIENVKPILAHAVTLSIFRYDSPGSPIGLLY
jgi:hypothetical protein